MPTAIAIKMNPTNLIRVYKKVLRYYTEYGEKKSPENNDLEMNHLSEEETEEDKNASTEEGDVTL